MLDYILVLFAVVLLALGFIIQKIYQRGLQSTTEGSVLFSIVSARDPLGTYRKRRAAG